MNNLNPNPSLNPNPNPNRPVDPKAKIVCQLEWAKRKDGCLSATCGWYDIAIDLEASLIEIRATDYHTGPIWIDGRDIVLRLADATGKSAAMAPESKSEPASAIKPDQSTGE